MKRRFIGGEHYWKPSLLFSQKKFDLDEYLQVKYPNKEFTFTGGGFYSLYRIIDDICFGKNDEILFPSYLCPTILIPFQKRKIKYRFFKVNQNLDIDIEDLNRKINKKTKAVLFINYFGFPTKQQTKKYLLSLKEKNVTLIEDIVQSFFSGIELIGDYAFNSFRKFMPVDASVIISDKKIIKSYDKKKTTKYNLYKFIGQFLRYLTIEYQIIDFSKLFLNFFAKANENYYCYEYVDINYLNKLLLSKLDVQKLIESNIKNYTILLEQLSKVALFNNLVGSTVPLGFPILINKNRDNFRKKLMKENIFCPIHWKLSKEINENEFSESYNLSHKILTIPIRGNINNKTLKTIKKILEY